MLSTHLSASLGASADPSAVSSPGAQSASGQRRLIFVNRYFHPDVSATSQLLTDLVGALSKESIDGGRLELHVICSRQLYGDARARLSARGRYADAQVHRGWSLRFGRDRLLGRAADYVSFSLSATLWLWRLTRPEDIVVVMTDPPLMSVCAAGVAKLRGAQLINWLQDVFPEVAFALGVANLPAWATRWMMAARNWALRRAARNVVLGLNMRRHIKSLGIAGGALSVIENWADAEALTPRSPQRSSLRRSLRAGGTFVIQYSGNMGRAHEYETLLGAASALNDEPGWLFLFVGGGAKMQSLRRAAEQAELRNMQFLPLQPRELLADSLAAADVHVSCLLPGLEGLIVPSKLYGILAAGRAAIVIGDPDGEQARVVRTGGCGSVIACGDVAGLVDELRRMRSEPEWLQKAGLNARLLFEERYTATSAVSKWKQMLEEVTKPESAPSVVTIQQ